jgi:phospholipase C
VVERRTPGRRRIAAVAILALVLTAACTSAEADKRALPAPRVGLVGIHKIRHVVMIMQENRSFDSYFGTFPGADGIPMANGKPTVCSPDPATRKCIAPFVDHHDVNGGGPHSVKAAQRDIDGGKMDGFVHASLATQKGCTNAFAPACIQDLRRDGKPDVMGYHT